MPFNRLGVALAVGIFVGLGALLLGTLLATIPIPWIVVIGAWLVQWAWVLGLAAALYSFASGRASIV